MNYSWLSSLIIFYVTAYGMEEPLGKLDKLVLFHVVCALGFETIYNDVRTHRFNVSPDHNLDTGHRPYCLTVLCSKKRKSYLSSLAFQRYEETHVDGHVLDLHSNYRYFPTERLDHFTGFELINEEIIKLETFYYNKKSLLEVLSYFDPQKTTPNNA